MHSFSYPATFRRDAKGCIVVGFPDLPEAHTDGRGMAKAIKEAVDCLGSVLAFRIAEKSKIPALSRLKRAQRLVPVPLWIAGKLV
jgi:predicted RNase H-like HicB family nuclease